MKPTVRTLIAVVAIVGLAGCAGHKKMVNPDTGAKMKVPEWYENPPQKDDWMSGVATATSLDLQTAVDKGKQDARADIARQLDLKMEGLSKRFVEETGLGADAELLDMFTQVSKSIVSESLMGTQVEKQELAQEGTVYRAYVMMRMPLGEANAKLLENIQAQKRLYTRFRASEAFEELEEEVERYEAWKQEQGFE
jgi:hypothetical protein